VRVVLYQGLTVFCYGFVQASCRYIKMYFTCCLSKGNYWGLSVWVLTKGSITDHIFCICQIHEGGKKGNTMRQCIEFKEAYDSVRWKVLYNIPIEFGITMKW